MVGAPDGDDRRLWRHRSQEHRWPGRRRALDGQRIAFLAVITASVTAALVEAGRARLAPAPERAMPELAKEIAARLASIESRMEQLEARPRPDHD
jgi:hypothetical protein